MPLKHLGWLCFFLFPFGLFAQTDTLNTPKQKLVIVPVKTISDSMFRFNTKKPLPKRAALYSALLPGLGQAYNKQYWKSGIVAAGAGAITYFIVSNRQEYLRYQKDYIYRIDNNPETVTSFPNYTNDDVKLLRTGFRKYYEYSIIAASVGYLLNILDSYTSAHLKSFDMSKDISYRLQPGYSAQPVTLCLSFNIK